MSDTSLSSEKEASEAEALFAKSQFEALMKKIYMYTSLRKKETGEVEEEFALEGGFQSEEPAGVPMVVAEGGGEEVRVPEFEEMREDFLVLGKSMDVLERGGAMMSSAVWTPVRNMMESYLASMVAPVLVEDRLEVVKPVIDHFERHEGELIEASVIGESVLDWVETVDMGLAQYIKDKKGGVENWNDPTLYISQMENYADRLGEQAIWDDRDCRTMAGILRIAEAVKRPDSLDKDRADEFLRKLNEYLSRQNEHSLGFEVANNLLQFVYDDSEEWGMGDLSEERKKWCVDQLVGRLKEVENFDTEEGKRVLRDIDSIITRTNTEQTLSGEPETYVSKEDLEPVLKILEENPDMEKVMTEDKRKRMQAMTDQFNTQKSGQE